MRFVFLIYTQRSGSTVFARHLAASCSSIVVLPEFRLVEHALAASEDVHEPLQQVKQLIELDHQFCNLGFQDAEIEGITNLNQPTVRELLEVIVKTYMARKGIRADIAVIKGNEFLGWRKRLLEHMPESSFLHIYRDPRAVANSMIRSRRPYFPKEFMGRGDPWYIAKYWSLYLRDVERLRKSGVLLYEVRYEEFLNNTDQVLRSTIQTLGVKFSKNPDSNVDSIFGEKEAGIHQLVSKPLSSSREIAWQVELRPWQGIVIERICNVEMVKHNYQRYFWARVKGPKRIYFLIKGIIFHGYASFTHYLRRSSYYLLRWQKARGRLRVFTSRHAAKR